MNGRANELDRFAQMGGKYRTNAIIAAAKPNQVSHDVGGHGLFTKYLCEALRGAADRDANGSVSLMEAAEYVSRVVPARSKELTPRLQEPVWSTNSPERARALEITSFPPH